MSTVSCEPDLSDTDGGRKTLREGCKLVLVAERRRQVKMIQCLIDHPVVDVCRYIHSLPFPIQGEVTRVLSHPSCPLRRVRVR